MNLSKGAAKYFRMIKAFVARYGAWRFFASQRWIAERLNCSVRSVKRWLAELREKGVIATKRRSQETMIYNVLRETLAPQMAPQMAPRIKEESSIVFPSERNNCRLSKKPPQRENRPTTDWFLVEKLWRGGMDEAEAVRRATA